MKVYLWISCLPVQDAAIVALVAYVKLVAAAEAAGAETPCLTDLLTILVPSRLIFRVL